MPVCGSGVLVCSSSLLIRRPQRARRQAETPPIVLSRFPRPALRMERALGKLRSEIDRSIHLMDHFLPHDTLAHIGRSFTLSAIVDALGEEARPSSTVAVRMLADVR